MERVDMEEVIEHAPLQFDLLVFAYNGNASGNEETSLVFVIRDTNAVESITQMSDMEELGFMINGCSVVSSADTLPGYSDDLPYTLPGIQRSGKLVLAP